MNTSLNGSQQLNSEFKVIDIEDSSNTNDDFEMKSLLEELFSEMHQAIINSPDETINSPEQEFSKYLWVINVKTKEIETINATAEKLIAEIQEWSNQRILMHQKQIDFLLARIEGYLRQSNLKSLNLPSGTVGIKKLTEKIEIEDEEVFYDNAIETFLRRLPETVEPNLKAIKEHFKSTGEIPRGVKIVKQDSKFYYKLK